MRVHVRVTDMPLLLPLLAALIPVLILPRSFFYFDITPKLVLLLVGTAAIACSPRNTGLIQSLWKTRGGRVLIVIVLCQLLTLAISTLVSANPALSMDGGNWRRFGFLTQSALLLFTVLMTARIATGGLSLLPTLRAVSLSGLCVALYACAQYFGWDPFLPSSAYHVGEGIWTIVRPPGTIGHADYLATYLLFVVFLGGSLVRLDTAKPWRLIGVLAALFGAIAITLSGTRSALLGLAAGILYLATGLPRRAAFAVGASVGCVILALVGLYISPAGQKLRGRTRWYMEDPLGGARPLLWRDSLSMAMPRLLTGGGAETFSAQFPRYQSVQLAHAYPDFYHESPHNIFIDSAVSQGALGAVSLFAAVVAAAIAAWRTRHDPLHLALGSAFIAALVSLEFNAFVLTTAFFFWISVALLLTSEVTPPGSEQLPRWARWSGMGAGVMVAMIFVVYAIRLTVADVALAQVRGYFAAGQTEQAITEYAVVRKWQPSGVNSDLYYSRMMSDASKRQPSLLKALKVWQETVQSALRATEVGEDPQNAYFHLAALYASLNDGIDAERSLKGAITVAPQWFKPHWMLAQVLRADGRLAEAKEQARLAASLDGGKHPEVAETFRQISY